MATSTLYLDVDDEITSAAARIRGSEATKVALVVPYGSRIATSRMNFRLLSREAVVNNRRLSIVASDPATRALAASAGLPVFSNVAEWETAVGPPAEAAETDATDGADGVTAPVAPPADDVSAVASPKPTRSKKRAKPAEDDAGPTLGLAAGAAAAGAGAGAATVPKSTAPPRPSADASLATDATTRWTPPPSRPSTEDRPASRLSLPVVRSRPRIRVGAPLAVVAGAVAIALVVAGVGAYVFLPSAEIVVTPREEAIGPIALTVRADPDVTAPDAESNVVPAEVFEVPVQVSNTFQTTGVRVVEEPAKGEVTFRNVDFTSTNTIPGGSVVSTPGGVKFTTNSSVTVPKAELVGLQIVPAFVDVGVTAVKAGTTGNLEPNTITVIPPGEDPTTLSVRNQRATTGGTHEEFPQIAEAEVTAAVEALTAQLGEAFAAEIGAGAGAPANVTVFDETAALGEPTPTVDPATLIGQEQASFDLGLTATGTVIGVDSSPVASIAETRLLANVGADHRLVEGSIEITPGDPTVTNGEVTFPVTAKAARVRILDPDELLNLVKGRPLEDARAALAEFGEVEVSAWPEWVSTIPSLDSRVTVQIVGQTESVDGGDPAASPTPSASESP